MMIILIIALIFASIRGIDCKRYVMPWMCLEICDSKESIQEQLDVLRDKSDILSGVSFELYTLADDCVLSNFDYMNMTHVNQDIIEMGLDNWPMISSWPHPPEFITWIRKVIYDDECSQKFINEAISEAKKNNYFGYNLDWEPTYSNTTLPINSNDALAYAKFVDNFAKQLHIHGYKLGVDFATWKTSPDGTGPSFWNIEALGKTAVDKGISMGTYTSNDDSFINQLNILIDGFGESRSGVGIESLNASNSSPLSANEIKFRFNAIVDAGLTEIDIWDMPIPESFWPYIEKFVNEDDDY
jgi:hypothetical protein